MKRQIRHIMPLCSALLMVFVAIFVVLPRDVCLGKVIADSCHCAHSTIESAECHCCNLGKKIFGCADHSGNTATPDSNTSDNPPRTCFSVSSEHSQLKSAERIHSLSIEQAVIAILPLPVEITVGRQTVISDPGTDHTRSRGDIHIHRDNCVFLI